MRTWLARHLPEDEVLQTLLPAPLWRWLLAPEPHQYVTFNTEWPDGPQQTQCVKCADFGWREVVAGVVVDQGTGCPRFRRWLPNQSVIVWRNR